MKALIQKDLRENLKAALIGLLIFSGILLQAYHAGGVTLASLLGGGMAAEDALQPLLWPTLQDEAAWFCGIFGAVLGWLQNRNEAHADLWAFLVHRPVTRTEIFWGKTISGLCLYVFGAGLPLVVFVGVARWPGHVAAPFEWAMVLPLFFIFLSGAAFYFAGMLTGLRQARWYVSRGFGLGPAILALMCLNYLTEFREVLLVVAVAVVILMAAVWGAYQSGGSYRGQPLGGRLALAAAMAAGCVAVIATGRLLFDRVVFPLPVYGIYSYYYGMTKEGVIYKVLPSLNNSRGEILDLDGHPMLDPKTGRKIETDFSVSYKIFSRFKSQSAPRNVVQKVASIFTFLNLTDNTLWYFDGHGKLAGYDGRTRRYIGTLDPRADDGPPPSEPFLSLPYAQFYYSVYNDEPVKLLATAKTLYLADFKGRALKPVFSVSNDDEIAGYIWWGIFDEGSWQHVLVATRRTVCLLDSNGRTNFAVPYQPGGVEYPQVQISLLQATNASMAQCAVWFLPDEELNRKSGWTMPVHVLWLGAGQTVVKSADLPALHAPEYAASWPERLAASILPPLAPVSFDNQGYRPWKALSFALAFISAGIGWALTRRYNTPVAAGIGWTLLILVLGIAGLLTLLCVQEWPAREVCPHCKKLRAVDRESCEHCQSPFGPPPKNGTEIFAPLAKAGAAKA